MPRLAQFKGEIIQSGVHPGLPNQQIPLWESGDNFVFRDNSAKIAANHTPLFERGSSLAGTGVFPIDNDGSPALVWGTNEALYYGLSSPATNDVTRAVGGDYTGTASHRWSFAQFGTIILATNGKDEVQYKANAANADPFVDLSDVADLPDTFRCNILHGTGSFVLAFNTDNIDTEYRWCDEDDVTVWLPYATNKARDMNIRELSSGILAVSKLAEYMVAHGATQNYIVGFGGAPLYFPWQHLLNGVGAVSKHSIAVVGRQLFGFGPNGIFVVDGTVFDYIDSPSMHKYVYETMYDETRANEVTAWPDANETIVYFSFPTVGGGGETVGFNYDTGMWSMYQWHRTAACDGGLWNHPVMVDDSGQVWIQTPHAGAFTSPGAPLGIDDSTTFQSYYGYGGYGRGGYGGTWSGVD